MAAPKNSAYTQGMEAAKKYLAHTIAITEEQWKTLAEQYASGHVSSSTARCHFKQGWLTVVPTDFAVNDEVTLQVRIMNIYSSVLNEQRELTPPEKEMYSLFGAWSGIEFVGETDICFTYKLITSCAVANRMNCCQFLKQKMISYKVQ